ncbi:phosphonate ABC transporter substrate-binding protein [Paroceanicella profunda]|uniref:Phosphonate ABC transporter substrate-binding protein n=1 Tax=Paroceanicella profunda TaxID=2579971 RepID=A0A5B8G058_9RHOB|nr:phosphonate ABC transporter substrate-binding protein [Paroceanicella profunda]QDL91863.1 phosphonate ABC transporter substrate-binding protein [Paroceanicella profunda]
MFLKSILAAGTAAVALSAVSASADGMGGIKEFRIGILGGENEADRLRSNECIKTRFEELLGVPVSLYPAADYAGVMEGLLGGNLDYAQLGASGYAGVYLENPDAVTPILTVQQVDGSTGYYSVMVARADSGIKTIEDMKGKRLGFADPNSTSGYLIPSVALPKQGYDVNSFFGSTSFSGGHEQNVIAVLNGDVDAGVTWVSGVGEWDEGYSNGNLRKMVDKGLLDMNDIVQIWQSPLIPNGPNVVSNALPQEVKDAVKASLLALPKDDPECFYSSEAGEAQGYVEVDPSFYETVIDARRAKLTN